MKLIYNLKDIVKIIKKNEAYILENSYLSMDKLEIIYELEDHRRQLDTISLQHAVEYIHYINEKVLNNQLLECDSTHFQTSYIEQDNSNIKLILKN